MYGVDSDAAWASAHAMQGSDTPISPGEVVRHQSDGRSYVLEGILPNLLALCRLLPSEGDPNFTREFPYTELVRLQHINLAEMMHSRGTVILGNNLTGQEIGVLIKMQLNSAPE